MKIDVMIAIVASFIAAVICCVFLWVELFDGAASWFDDVEPPEIVEVPVIYVPLIR